MLVKGADLAGAGDADLLVRDGVVARGRLGLRPAATPSVIDADGLVALPGLVDLHTHLREPGREDAETDRHRSRPPRPSAATPPCSPWPTPPRSPTPPRRPSGSSTSAPAAGLVDVSPVGAVTKGLAGEELAELGADGRLARPGAGLLRRRALRRTTRRVMRRALEYVRAFGGVVSQHAQDPRLAGRAACCHEGEVSGRLGLPGWPGVAEESIIARDVHARRAHRLAGCTSPTSPPPARSRSSAGPRRQGIEVTAEVTPHHLLLTDDLLAGYDPVYKVNPPLRPAEDVEALRAALADGTIDAVATDHAPHARHDKEHAFVDAAFGMLGLETALSGGQRRHGRRPACSTGPASPG